MERALRGHGSPGHDVAPDGEEKSNNFESEGTKRECV